MTSLRRGRPIYSGLYGPADGPAFRQDVRAAAQALDRRGEPISRTRLAAAMTLDRKTLLRYVALFAVDVDELRRELLHRRLADLSP